FLASGATPGVLHPGESVRVPVYYAGWQQPWDLTYPPINFNLGVLQADDPTPIDWAGMKDSVRPSSISAEAWNPLYANLVAQTGTTLGNYVTMLDNNASYLGRLGESITDVGKLWPFAIQQANGQGPDSQLASALDAEIPAPGMVLNFSRSFSPLLTGRYQ